MMCWNLKRVARSVKTNKFSYTVKEKQQIAFIFDISFQSLILLLMIVELVSD